MAQIDFLLAVVLGGTLGVFLFLLSRGGRLHTLVNELAGVISLFSRTGDRIRADLDKHRQIMAGDLLAVSTGLGSVQQRVEMVLKRVPEVAEREREYRRWVDAVRKAAREAATPLKPYKAKGYALRAMPSARLLSSGIVKPKAATKKGKR